MAHFHRLEQHLVEREEHRDLHDHRQAAGNRIDLLLLVQLHHVLAELFAVVLVPLLQVLHARLQVAHARHRATRRLGQLVEHQLDQQRHEHDRDAPVVEELVDEGQRPEQRLGQRREPFAVVVRVGQ